MIQIDHHTTHDFFHISLYQLIQIQFTPNSSARPAVPIMSSFGTKESDPRGAEPHPALGLPASCQLPKNPILRVLFEILCFMAVSQMSLDHWQNTTNEEWKEHTKVMSQRFQNSNITVSLYYMYYNHIFIAEA